LADSIFFSRPAAIDPDPSYCNWLYNKDIRPIIRIIPNISFSGMNCAKQSHAGDDLILAELRTKEVSYDADNASL
jgi:hypothetical protein